jgi:O-antigen/teichoic acid export membrane protein
MTSTPHTLTDASTLSLLSTNLKGRLVRELSWVILGQGVAILGGLFGVRLMTGALTPEVYGELALGMTLATLGHQIIFGPLTNAFMRFFAPAHEAGKLGSFLIAVRSLLTKTTLIVLIALAPLVVGCWLLSNLKWIELAVAAVVFSLFSFYSATLNGTQNAARQRSIVALHQGAGQWLRFLTAVGMICIFGMSSAVAMLGYALALLPILFSQFLFFRYRILSLARKEAKAHQEEIRRSSKQILHYAWPFTTWGIITWAHFASDRWALQIFHTTHEVGLYAVLYQLGFYPVGLLTGIVMQFILPILFNWAGDSSDHSRMSKVAHLNNLVLIGCLLTTFLGASFLAIFHTEVFSILVSPDYHSVSTLLPVMFLASGIFACGQIASTLPMARTNTRILIFPKVVTGFIGLFLNFLAAFFFGLIGLVFAILLCSVINFLWLVSINKSHSVCPV